MPEHSTWLTMALEYIKGTLHHNAEALGKTFIGNRDAGWHDFEPIATSLIVALLLILIGIYVRARLSKLDQAVVPDDSLTLRTFVEAFLGYFYDLAKSMMDAERAKRYFPLIGTSATFVFLANVMALIPGFPVATSHLSITLGCALVVFILFNIYGLATNGLAYLGHMAGPVWYMWWLIFPIELISLFVRPITLAVRLMLNMAVDHLLLMIFLSLFAVLVPLPILLLGCLVVVVQTLVFTLLTCIYIALATEHEAH